jgi:isopentenyldiphosphate isomerase
MELESLPAPGQGDDPDELFDRVDAADHVIGRVRRGEAHRDPRMIHRSVQVLVFASDGRVLLQRRSAAKDLFPGCYCASASGHVASGEDYTTTARRELREELGIAPALAYLGKETVSSAEETEITALFAARSDGPFTFHPTETAGGELFTLDELRGARQRDSLALTPAARVAFAALDRLDHAGLLAGLLAML